jgi:hypothetical protein
MVLRVIAGALSNGGQSLHDACRKSVNCLEAAALSNHVLFIVRTQRLPVHWVIRGWQGGTDERVKLSRIP